VSHKVVFCPSGRGKARCPPDPAYPNGKKIDLEIQPNCEVQLPYPAPECGQFVITCNDCKAAVIATAAGRPDDPVSITVPCDTAAIN